MSSAEISITSRVDATPDRVWERVTSPEGINHEMRPWMRMTLPRGVEGLSIDQVEVGKPIGRSWILLFGLIPIDFDELNIARLDPGRGFLERSRMLSQRSWEHERTIEPDGNGSLVTDRIRWQPRLGLPAAALRPMFRAFFRHRHRRLQSHFAGQAPS
jgi:ligand-binding SRPBCC domain-containing protein